MPSTNEIRAAFLNYFANNGHEIVASGPLVPHNDPSLLFTNAGMVQFKNVFTGNEKRPIPRAVTSQKCVRAGGKHNDLENVGYTARHHTFFEMLGNFSFGDYFKERAIQLSWNLVHKEFGLDPDRLLVTVFHSDDDAFNLWRSISGLHESRIIKIDTTDNFWAMGDTGPCGPCSEIFYDHGQSIAGGPPGSIDQDGDRFVEIWNLVFMQFEERPGGERVDLPNPAIDTGMGLERITAVLQGVHDNYDTDLFKRLIAASVEASGVAADGIHLSSHRVVTDHLRAASFLLADGVMPSNEGRGYVLRRIMRRGMRHAHMMGVKEPLLWRLVPTLVKEMGQAFTELERAQLLITETLKLEEARFRETLGRGLRLLDEATKTLSDGANLPGEVAFKLYDTYGFPLDLTEDALRAQGRTVDRTGFDTAMAHQRAEARRNWTGSGESGTDELWFEIREAVGVTEFLGYNTNDADGEVVSIIKEAQQVDHAEAGSDVMVVVNQTPFYAESGGQVGDAGTITDPTSLHVEVANTIAMADNLYVHSGRVTSGTLALGTAVHLEVNAERRSAVQRNHSATHLLHAALRRHLGEHVSQKGSLVAPDRLRFDISHTKAIHGEELLVIETEVNREILGNNLVTTTLMKPEEAIQHGALALFGEKYGDEVRVISMGGSNGKHYSTELCGGTHVTRTGEIGLFRIVSEGTVGAGIRRIDALTGTGALTYSQQQDDFLRASTDVLKVRPSELSKRIRTLLAERKQLETELADARRLLAIGGNATEIFADTREIGGIKFAARRLHRVPARDLRGLADDLKKKIGSGVVALVTETDGKAAIVVGVTDELTDRVDAVKLVRSGAAALGGKGGGGRPDLAQAGGPDIGSIDKALESVAQVLTDITSSSNG